MRVYVELPDGWGPSRVILTAWEQAGYHVEEVRSLATGDGRMIVRGLERGQQGPVAGTSLRREADHSFEKVADRNGEVRGSRRDDRQGTCPG